MKATGRGAGASGNPFAKYPSYCTYGAWEHAQWLGSAVYGNARDWYAEAQRAKLPTGTTPRAGAVFVWMIGYYGHVGLVTGPGAGGSFPTMEMNGGTITDPVNGITTEFGKWLPHTRHTGPDMFFIYPPGPPPFDPSQYNGHIVKQDNGTSTAWLVVDAQGHRNWIPDEATYNCLKSAGHPGPDLLSAAQLNQLPDQNGVWAHCSTSGGGSSGGGGSGGSGGGGGGNGGSGGSGGSGGGGSGGGGSDTTPPSVPAGLSVSNQTTSSLRLNWAASSDNVGVSGYDVLLNGAKTATVTTTYGDFAGLSCGSQYTLGVEARDAAGNVSAVASVSGSTAACPSPSVWVTKGAAQTTSGCTSVTYCYQFVVHFANFPPGNHNVVCYSDYPPPAGPYRSYTTADGTSYGCLSYGYPNTHVWASVDGVVSAQLLW